MLWRAAFLALALALAPRLAWAGGVHFSVPVYLEGLPPQVTDYVVDCYVADAAGHTMGGGEARGHLAGGLVANLDMIVRVNNSSHGGAPTSYRCRLVLGGETVDHRPFQFWSTDPFDSHGWRNRTYGLAASPHLALARAPGTALNMAVSGRIAAATADELMEPADCPCGCGGTIAQGTSACMPGAPGTLTLPGARQPAQSPSTRTAPSSRVTGALRGGPASAIAAPSPAVTTPHFAFTGDNALTTLP